MSRAAPGTLLWITLAPGKLALAKVLHAQHDSVMLHVADQLFDGAAPPAPLPPFVTKHFINAKDVPADGADPTGPIARAGGGHAPVDPKDTTRVRGGAVYIQSDNVRAWIPGKDKLPMDIPVAARALVTALRKRLGLSR
ncbi:MAG TPA: hypothetical protein VM261_00340 [Kofleriaceae bacterium]|nr:hypothetical protein [Kofleriaceae bacterium]